VGGQLWLAQLYNFLHQRKATDGAPQTVAWQSNDGKGNVWLADNIDVMDKDDIVFCPAYTTISEAQVVMVMQRGFVLSTMGFWAQIATAVMRGENVRKALLDPEVSLSFSNTYIKKGVPPAPVRLLLLKDGGAKVAHFEIDLQETREKNPNSIITDRHKNNGHALVERCFFNEQVTHTAHLRGTDGQGCLACVSFECPRILLLKEEAFLKVINA